MYPKLFFSWVFIDLFGQKIWLSKYIGVFALLDYKCKNLGKGYGTKCGGKLEYQGSQSSQNFPPLHHKTLVYCEKVGRENYRVGKVHTWIVNVFFSPFSDKEIGKILEIFPTENLTNFAKFLLKFAKILKSKYLGKYVSTYTHYLSLFTRAKVKCELFPVLTHLSTKEGSLFVLFCVSQRDPQNQDASDHVLNISGKLLKIRISWCLDLQCKSSWILNNFFTENEIKS
jgi:hypothetical protein